MSPVLKTETCAVSTRSWTEVSHLPSFCPLLPKTAQLLTDLAQSRGCEGSPPSVFDATSPPPVSLSDFLVRLCKHAHCSPQVWVCTLVNADRMLQKSRLAFTPLNVHRLFLSSFVVTAKFLDDISYGNKWYSDVAGISVQELNILEMCFLKKIDFNLCTKQEQVDRYKESICDADADESEGLSTEGDTESRCTGSSSASAYVRQVYQTQRSYSGKMQP
eukprot:TRINITY_DN5860_c0_g1_i1.p1 TRINITY_DN5860_c0_g1~~TRINITY_DN5860_c0_g1_i1.p1  ORF type:complete len:218 (+),score=38.65 TRINITY_DN5860_c0_g1_i1:347-1000(+)